MSYLIRGLPPTHRDLLAVKDLTGNALKSYLLDKSNTYMSSPEFAIKMGENLNGLFRFSVKEDSSLTGQNGTTRITDADYLFRKIARENLDWSLLATDNHIQFNTSKNADIIRVKTARQFYSTIFPDLTNQSQRVSEYIQRQNGIVNIRPTSDDQRKSLAGAITTTTFFERYGTTKINENRRRAANIFRVFLCDDMKPVVIGSSAEDRELLQRSRIRQGANINAPVKTDAERHGGDAACQSCHYKLDPMGKVFAGNSTTLTGISSQGALVFKNSRGDIVDLPVNGFAELGRAIVSQPEYLSCQVRHFWNWYVGSDVALTESVKRELVAEFERVDRKPKEFIRNLVQRNEFSKGPSDIPTVANVKPIFNQCYQCHSSSGTSWIPDFSNLPKSQDKKFVKDWLSAIVNELDLENDGKNATMPAKELTSWRLTKEETQLVKAWIVNGAKDDDGNSSLSDIEISEVISNRNLVSKKVTATYFDTYRRFVNAMDYMRTMRYVASRSVEGYNNSCILGDNTSFDSDRQKLLGMKDPVDGNPSAKTPSPNAVNAFFDCAQNVMSMLFNRASESWIHTPPSFAPYIDPSKPASYQPQPLDSKVWGPLISQYYNRFIGPKVLPVAEERRLLQRIYGRVNTYVSNRTDLNYIDVNKMILMTLLTSEEFLTY